MKRFFAILLAVLTCASLFAACGEPAVSEDPAIGETEPTVTDALETDAPVTEAPVTEAPKPDETQEVPADPTFDPDEDEKDEDNTVYEYDFENGAKDIEGFTILTDHAELGEGGYRITGNNGSIRVRDNTLQLHESNVMVEADITFDVLPHKAEGVTNFPLSIISWIGRNASQAFYDWSFKLDDEGYIYINDGNTRTDAKIEAGKRYTLGVLYDKDNQKLTVYVDGAVVGSKSYSVREWIESDIRIYDGGTGKAHFSSTLHAVRAYKWNPTDMLKDATRSIYDVVAQNPSAQLLFEGHTDKDALSYKVGEEMSFEIYLTANSEVVSAPYFYYSVEGEDGQKKTEGYANGDKGHFTVKAKMTKPGAVRVKAYICDENKVKQTKSNSKFYVDLSTTTPQKADLMFKGGAIAGLEQIEAGGKIPTDLEEYWNGVVADCYKGDLKLLRFDKLDPKKYGGSDSFDLYLVELESAGGFATGYLTVPKDSSALKLRCNFVSYGNAKKPNPSFVSGTASFSICAHSYHLDDPNAIVPDKNGKSYGFYMPENNDRDTTYFKGMFVRNITAVRFLKAYIGDASYGKIIFNGSTVSPLNRWKKGDELYVQGGSQASFQSVGIAALDKDVTRASFGVPWFCDIGGDLVGRFSGWNPDYTDALMYYDSVALATLIEKDVSVTITAGLGDTTSEPSGVCALYNALDCKVTMSMKQNREHTYDPLVAMNYRVSK